MKRKLHELAHARAGDKGDTLTLALIAYREADYPLLRERVTAQAVKQHLAHIVRGDVRRVILRRFPYALFYTIEGSDVVVLACVHERRSPDHWPLG